MTQPQCDVGHFSDELGTCRQHVKVGFSDRVPLSAGENFPFVLLEIPILGLAFVCGVAGVDLWKLRKRGRSATIFFMSMFGLYGLAAALTSWEGLRIPDSRAFGLAQSLGGSGILAYSLWAVGYLLLPKTRRKFDATPVASAALTTPGVVGRARDIVALGSLASSVCIIAAYLFANLKTVDWFVGLLFISPCWLPYVFIFFRFRGDQPKTGFSLAIAMGFAAFAPAIAVLYYAHEWHGVWRIQGSLLLLVMLQPILIGAAIRAYNSLPTRPRDRLKLAMSIAYGVALSLGFWLFAGYGNFPTLVESNEKSAMESMRSVYMATGVYSRDHGGFFPESMGTWDSELQDRCRAYYWTEGGANHVVGGYSFDYRGEPSDKTVQGCRVAKNYVATARPVVFGKTGRRSFFVDQTGIIRCTSENRAETASDPPIPPGSLTPL